MTRIVWIRRQVRLIADLKHEDVGSITFCRHIILHALRDGRLAGRIIKSAIYFEIPDEITADGMAKVQDRVLVRVGRDIAGLRGITTNPDAFHSQRLQQRHHVGVGSA